MKLYLIRSVNWRPLFFLLIGMMAIGCSNDSTRLAATVQSEETATFTIGSYYLIYLDSTDASMATSNEALTFSFRDPWGNPYKHVEFLRSTQVIKVTSYASPYEEGATDTTEELAPAATGEYAAELDRLLQLTDEFMWGWAPYTIGERPEKPANPELQAEMDYLKKVICQTRGVCP
jgi:hypothetical protein